MSKGAPDLKKFMDKQLSIRLNGNRQVIGVLRGFDQFMNIVLENAVEDKGAQGKFPIPDMIVIRGNSIALMEPLEAIVDKR
mmetsp:Transcript_467/g.601  ORF Transcript_467/g.601 Transcript_467/m.601 type:complete len:81 (-) Transcript_467:79-321(-)